jgi:hypothetical protein
VVRAKRLYVNKIHSTFRQVCRVLKDDNLSNFPLVGEVSEKEGSRAQYYAGLCTHPNLLATQLSRPSAFGRLRRHLPSDLPHRFCLQTNTHATNSKINEEKQKKTQMESCKV